VKSGNLRQGIPADLPEELSEVLASGTGSFRLERIVSRNHASPEGFWYEEETAEWVGLISGAAVLRFEDGETVAMSPGDWIEIPPRVRHRVESTSSTEDSVWLALHWSGGVESPDITGE